MFSRSKRAYLVLVAVGVFLFAALALTRLDIPKAYASNAITDNGLIIPDSFMRDTTTLSNSIKVQEFLDRRVASCAVSICLKNYNEAGVSAATLIAGSAAQYGINPELLIVLIQSQTGLITDSSPTQSMFAHATGYECSASDGNCLFSRQLSLSAKYFADALSGTIDAKYVSGSSYSIPWSINTACGTSSVTMKNTATATLYSYSQNFGYQPNTSAISDRYGPGDGCSEYGIRNFHNYAYDWFIEPVTMPEDLAVSPVYRFWSPNNQHHFFTASAQERDIIIAKYPTAVWKYEGVAFNAPQDDQCSNTAPVYRFWSNKNQAHFYTISAQEKDVVIATYDMNTWKYEGVAYCAHSHQVSGTKPVYRFWSPRLQGHFYTSSDQEKNVILSTYPSTVWRYEGIAYYLK